MKRVAAWLLGLPFIVVPTSMMLLGIAGIGPMAWDRAAIIPFWSPLLCFAGVAVGLGIIELVRAPREPRDT